MNDQALLFEIDNGVATLTLNRPESKNAMNMPMRAALRDAIYSIRLNRSVHAVILRGAGTAFCSGGDVRGMTVQSAEEGRNRIDDLHSWISQLVDLDRPTIAAVDGVAYGAGFSLALAADLVIASSRARFCMPFMKLGLIPDCAAFYTLPRAVGLARAKELIFTAREVSADEARDMGAVLEVVEPETLHTRAASIARALADASPVAFGLSKRALNMSLGSDLRTMLELESVTQAVAFTTDFHREAVRRFRDKETPLFTWPAA
ncbi:MULTISPECIES: enoyl-CoA hydratase/isomerase family protein [Paraburkholderia]|uniref:Enoyl-CoA hydratase-related protein n=1 Tax=Paraburkholderia metrosideri TaxID=580937 RepID=A0ABW9E538_9BURK